MTARVLLATPSAVEGERFRSMLGELPAFELGAVATTTTDVLARLAAEDPEVLVVSEDVGPVPVLDLVRQIARAHPFTAVVLLAGRADPETMRQAMEAGVRGMLPATFTLADVESRLEGAHVWAATVRRHVAGESAASGGTGRLLAFCGAKGGVGTSTLALHVALEAAGTGLRVCLVDLDLQTGDIGTLLDIKANRDIVDLVDIASDITGRALEDVLYRHASGLRVLLAPVEGERGEEVTAHVARAVLSALTSHFDVIVVDCGAVLGPAGAAAVSLADRTVTVLTPDTASVLGARRMHRLWDRLSLRSDEEGLVLVNRASRSNEVQPELVQKMLKLGKAPLPVPADFRALEASVNTGDPARLLDRDVRRAIATVARELDARREAPAAAEPASRRGRRAAPAGARMGRRRDSGQVAVEAAGAFTLVIVVCLLLLQGVLVGASYVLAGQAANEAARVAVARDATWSQVQQAGEDQLPGMWKRNALIVPAGRPGDAAADSAAAVEVTVRTPQVVPLIGRMFGDALEVSSRAQMRYEGTP